LKSSVATTADTCIPKKAIAAAMHRNQATKNGVTHGGQALLVMIGAGSGCSDDYHQ
jgi:hypothetical protein